MWRSHKTEEVIYLLQTPPPQGLLGAHTGAPLQAIGYATALRKHYLNSSTASGPPPLQEEEFTHVFARYKTIQHKTIIGAGLPAPMMVIGFLAQGSE
ncbi:MAG: hypothetical protein IJ277_06535 [Bacteroidaceae bacterium]|nr:hypothetical protein [Bacteroidaceae bacterium]